MQINYDIQTAILEEIKRSLDPDVSLADELADCLCVSKDSAYRRIRGETLFDISDIKKITNKYRLSLDSLFGLKKSNVSFNLQSINLTDFTFYDYFKSIEKNLSLIKGVDPKHIYYSARDIPIFHYFQDSELTSFKIFIWLKYYMHHPEFHKMKFDSKKLPDTLMHFLELSKRIWDLYLKIPSTEIWTYETPNITLRQIEFANQAGIIKPDSCEMLCNRFTSLLGHIQNQAEQGNKYTLGGNATLEGAEYNIYFHEVAIGDNSALFSMGNRKVAFNVYANLNYMSTADTAYTEYVEAHFQSTMKNSILISATSEKIRSKFFNALLNKVDIVASKIHTFSTLY
jgi:BetR domain